MTLAPGLRLGVYEIVSAIGAGGMGEVYRARDARLQRDVALKILPTAVATDPERLRRFEQEGRAAASLNHPNILVVHDVGVDAGVSFVVSELLDGESLRARLARGAIPPLKACEWGGQIARGLAAAHAKGLVHRDIKPDNLFVTRDGHVKILDFGLAKATAPTLEGDATRAVTRGVVTEPGTVMGTFAYMAPEQVRGLAADQRADLFAFGAVLLEMLTGVAVFARATPADTAMAILHESPPEEVGGSGPVAATLARLARRCLEKRPEDRFQSASDLAFALDGITSLGQWPAGAAAHDAQSSALSPELRRESGESAVQDAPMLSARVRRVLVSVVMAIAAALLAVAIDRLLRRPSSSTAQDRLAFTITLPPGARFPQGLPLAISADGQHIVFAAALADGRQQLFSRRLDRSTVVPLAGTEGGSSPFFSPDGSSIAFFANKQLKRMPASGGVASVICPAPNPRGGAWGPDDRIVFAPETNSGLFIVSSSGGTPEALTMPDAARGETSHRWPSVLPDGNGVLFTVSGNSGPRDMSIGALSFESRVRTEIQDNAMYAQYDNAGHLVYVTANGETFRAPFNPLALTVTGPAVPLPERPDAPGPFGAVGLAISRSGTLAWAPFETSGRRAALVVRPDGSSQALRLEPREYRAPRVSPDGTRIALMVLEGLLDRDIWVYDTASATISRVTDTRYSAQPLWSRDGGRLAFTTLENNTWKLLELQVDANSAPRAILPAAGRQTMPFGWLPDDRTVLFGSEDRLAQPSLGAAGQQPRALTLHGSGRFPRHFQGVSPDGRWLSYLSNQSGPWEVYVTSLPDGAITRQVSRDGGVSAVWAKSGSDLFYRRLHDIKPGEIMRVTVGADGRASAPRLALKGDYFLEGPGPQNVDYDVFADGSFLMLKDEGSPIVPRIDVVVGWVSQVAQPKAPR